MTATNTLAVGEAQLVPATGSNIVIATEGIIRAMPAGPGKLVISGIKNGRTDMLVLDDAGAVTERYQLIVAEHGDAKQTYQASLDDFRKIVKQIVGDHKIQFDVLIGPRIGFIGTNLVSSPKPVLFMHGEARDEIEADAIRAVASRFYGAADYGATQTTTGQGVGGTNVLLTTTITDLKNDPNIVDEITIARYHQVRIRVQVAEVNINAAKQKGIQYSDGVTWAISENALTIDQLSQDAAGTLLSQNILSGLFPLPVTGGGAAGAIRPSFKVTLQTLIQDQHARLLAEPTLVTKSGQQASFLSGGEVLQQQQSAIGVPSLVTIPFGVTLKIKPTVDRADHIDMEITSEVSEAPTVITDSGGSLQKTSRNVTNKLRLNHGDTLIIGGLLQNDMRNIIRKFPWLGQIPVLGALFRSKNWNHNQSELLFFITPEIIGDLPSDTARNVRTPMMKQWQYMDSHRDILPDPNSHASPDNDVHDFLSIPPDRAREAQPPASPGFAPPGTPPTAPIAPPFPPPASAPPEPKVERKYF
ncbi:MAG: pilus assembly protein N-terminal domain-containing protein [Verrucomicrobia bacterium]|nr:pilus assembly protein N-terminal domain-containing protein [Verrucomicrobiota bacterium]